MLNCKPAYILHTQAFSNTSLLVDIFTQDYGRLRLLAKGVRAAKSSRRAILQAFTPINLSWSGRSELKTLTQVELRHDISMLKLQGSALFNGLYANELLMKLTYANDPHEDLFDCYQQLLLDLSSSLPAELALRFFEYQLLECLGYSLGIEALGELQDSTLWYQYQPDMGLQLHSGQQTALPIVQGCYLFNLMHKQNADEDGMKQLKQLMRFVLHQHLDGKTIATRALYQ